MVERERGRVNKLNNLQTDDIMEQIARHLIRYGRFGDILNASLVCKQLYLALQKQFLLYAFLFFSLYSLFLSNDCFIIVCLSSSTLQCL